MSDDTLKNNGEATRIIPFNSLSQEWIASQKRFEESAAAIEKNVVPGDGVLILDQFGRPIPLDPPAVEPELLPAAESAPPGEKKEKMIGGITGKGFMPGQSGNPSGRPPKAKLLTDILEDYLKRECHVDNDITSRLKELAGKENPTWADIMAIGTVLLALRGNPAALKEIWERIDGKITQPISGPGGGDIPLRVKSRKKLTPEQSAALHQFLAGIQRAAAGGEKE